MLKHVVLLAVSLAGVTAPYAAEKAVVSVTMSQSRSASPSGPVDPVKKAWVTQTMDRFLGQASAPASAAHGDH